MAASPPVPSPDAAVASTPLQRPPSRIGRRWLVLALVLAVPPLLVRGCVLDAYAIEQSSMEPAFVAGDHLLVLRPWLDGRPVSRWDAVVLAGDIDPELPAGVGAMLKRIVGLPGEWLQLRDGDVYAAAPTGEYGAPGQLELVRKPDALVAELLVAVHRGAGLQAPWTWVGPGARTELPDGGTRLSAADGPAGEPGAAVFEQTLQDGQLSGGGEEAVRDTALAVTVGEGDGILELRLREGADVFRARLAPAERGGASLHHNLGGGVVAAAPEFPGLRAGQSVLFWNVDNGVRLRIDGQPILGYDYAENEPQPAGALIHNEPALLVEGGARELRDVTVLRDLHYSGRGIHAQAGAPASHVPDGQYFVLGDHSSQSRDSRYFGPVPSVEVLGRPVLRYAPWARACRLSPAGFP